MPRRSLVPTLTSFVVVSSLLTFLSCEINAKPEKKTEKGEKRVERKCCQPGFQGCPTSREDGCVCCGTKVTATFGEYNSQKTEGSLNIAGIDKPVNFYVDVNTYPGVAKTLQSMKKGDSGKFVLKLHMYEYDYPRQKDKTHVFSKWYGKRFECEGVGDDANLQDLTKEFVRGWKLSETVQKVRTTLEEAVPEYNQERDVDKDKQ